MARMVGDIRKSQVVAAWRRSLGAIVAGYSCRAIEAEISASQQRIQELQRRRDMLAGAITVKKKMEVGEHEF